MRQTHKMEAIGRLAGGVAHDFNNVLTAIFGYADLLLDQIPADDSRHGDVQEIRRAAERAAALTRQLLAFSRKQMIQPKGAQSQRSGGQPADAAGAARRGGHHRRSGHGGRYLERAGGSRADRTGPDEPRRQCARRDAGGRAADDRDEECSRRRGRRAPPAWPRARRLCHADRVGHGTRCTGKRAARTFSSHSSPPRARGREQGSASRRCTGS